MEYFSRQLLKRSYLPPSEDDSGLRYMSAHCVQRRGASAAAGLRGGGGGGERRIDSPFPSPTPICFLHLRPFSSSFCRGEATNPYYCATVLRHHLSSGAGDTLWPLFSPSGRRTVQHKQDPPRVYIPLSSIQWIYLRIGLCLVTRPPSTLTHAPGER